jgi:hypothetical protein
MWWDQLKQTKNLDEKEDLMEEVQRIFPREIFIQALL